MMRNVYLQGELGERFGSKFTMNVDTTQEIIKCINANRPEFRNYLVDCHEKDIGFVVEYQDKTLGDKELLTPMKEGDVTIAVVPAGSKSGLGKILAAVFIAFVALPLIGAHAMGSMTTAQLGTIFGEGFGLAMQAGLTTIAGKAVGMLAINLALTGIGELMAPDPSVDTDQPENYTFNGNQQHIGVGDPVPLLYGELRVPGRPISIDIKNGTYTNPATWIDGNGELNTITDESMIDPAVYDSWGYL